MILPPGTTAVPRHRPTVTPHEITRAGTLLHAVRRKSGVLNDRNSADIRSPASPKGAGMTQTSIAPNRLNGPSDQKSGARSSVDSTSSSMERFPSERHLITRHPSTNATARCATRRWSRS
jgi:hypothetical protein